MARIKLDNIKKEYKNGFEAIHGISLDIEEGGFLVLVGPSGCGKTTLLRMIAGLEEISDGSLYFDDRLVNDYSPRDRDIAMVFQNYALYPHMTVSQNIAFSLKMKKLPRKEIDSLVSNAAEILGLTDWLTRKPGQLSGGQRQRVAMGRAIVREPAAFLMDEPLSNLDAKLRVQMRAEVLRIQRRIGVSTIYVTHDQTEAMTMGDRVAVLRDGKLLQCATPQELYDHPLDMFVATFIGSPAMNLFEANLGPSATSVTLGSATMDLPEELLHARPGLAARADQPVVLGIRPEDFAIQGNSSHRSALDSSISLVESLGSEQVIHFVIDAKSVLAEGAQDVEEPALGSGLGVIEGGGVARLSSKLRVAPGERFRLFVDTSALHFFDPETSQSIWN